MVEIVPMHHCLDLRQITRRDMATMALKTARVRSVPTRWEGLTTGTDCRVAGVRASAKKCSVLLALGAEPSAAAA